MIPPPKPDGSPMFKQLDSKSSSWSDASADDEEKEDIITLAQRMPVASTAGAASAAGEEEPWEGESTEGFLQPLVLVHPATGRRSVFVHTVNMMRLEEADGTAMSWEDSQALICKLFQRVVRFCPRFLFCIPPSVVDSLLGPLFCFYFFTFFTFSFSRFLHFFHFWPGFDPKSSPKSTYQLSCDPGQP